MGSVGVLLLLPDISPNSAQDLNSTRQRFYEYHRFDFLLRVWHDTSPNTPPVTMPLIRLF